jgi:hypothetical protein
MKNFNLILIVYCILVFLPGFAQNKNPDSKKAKSNSGLIFNKKAVNIREDSSYTDLIQLMNLDGKVHALQFRLLINKADDDSTVLIFKDIQKGSDLSDASWLLDYNAIKGPILSNGAAKYEIFVVLYNTTQNGGLPPGDYSDLIKVNYKVPDMPNLKKDIKSSMKISHVEASTFNGFPINIAPAKNELKIHIKRK